MTRCFQLAAAAAGTAGVVVACDSGGGTGAGNGDAGDASSEVDGSVDDGPPMTDAGMHADADADAARDVVCEATIVLDDASTDGHDICDYTLTCGLEKKYMLAHAGCAVVPADPDGGPADGAGFPNCYVLEGHGCSDGGFVAAEGDPIVFQCVECMAGGGRRPPGLVPPRRARTAHPAGAHFADVAHLEAASVHAFERLARELAAHEAPRCLVAAARASARDEQRHAKSMGRLARRFGATVPRTEVRAVGRRSLAAIARDNAVEGCVREAFGALINTWQAAHAGDERVRAALTRIARDETRHAALSWEIAAWAETRLDPEERRSVNRARRRAVAKLAGDIRAPTPDALREHAGLPDARQRARLLASLDAQLWTSARP